jgi:hypothetical protein
VQKTVKNMHKIPKQRGLKTDGEKGQNCNFHTLKSRAITGTETQFPNYCDILYM